MSTVDPAIVRRQELIDQFQQPQRPNWLLWVLVLIAAALWGLFAYSVAHIAQYPVGDGYVAPLAYAADATPPMFWGIFVGAFGAFILGFLLSFVLAELYGLAATTWGSFAVTQIGWALGLWRGAADSWLPPVPVGASGGGNPAPSTPVPQRTAVSSAAQATADAARQEAKAPYWLPNTRLSRTSRSSFA